VRQSVSAQTYCWYHSKSAFYIMISSLLMKLKAKPLEALELPLCPPHNHACLNVSRTWSPSRKSLISPRSPAIV